MGYQPYWNEAIREMLRERIASIPGVATAAVDNLAKQAVFKIEIRVTTDRGFFRRLGIRARILAFAREVIPAGVWIDLTIRKSGSSLSKRSD